MIDELVLDTTNTEFNFASEFVMQTNRLVYLTGKAGTGKTTFLKYLTSTCKKNMVVLAPTGVAAVNAGGQTIHSFFNIKPSVYVPGDKRLRFHSSPQDAEMTTIVDHFRFNKEKLSLIRNLELLVIDEISMVRCDLLDVIDQLLRFTRRRHYTPFGGVQVILIGDTFQLPPIANHDDWSVLSRFYKSPYFFSSKVLESLVPVYIELKKVYRQTDEHFIELLNRIRINKLDNDDIKLLNSRYLHGFDPTNAEDYIILASHNRMVEETNQRRLEEINEDLFTFESELEGVFPENSLPADKLLQLKIGAQVMMLRNDRNKRYFNGKIGKVVDLGENIIKVRFNDETTVDVIKEQWDNIRYKWDEKDKKVIEESIGTFTQFPVRLAWAITVHKSQGLTFEKVIADVAEAFTHGQVYVALSRCTSFEGLLLRTPLHTRAIKTDPLVLQYASNEMPETMLLQVLEKSKTSTHVKTAIDSWMFKDFDRAAEYFMLSLEHDEKNRTRLLKLCDFALCRFARQSLALVEYASSLVEEVTTTGSCDKTTKKLINEADLLLKDQITLSQSLTSFMLDIEEIEDAADIIASHDNNLDKLISEMTRCRKSLKAAKKLGKEKVPELEDL